MSSHGLTFQLDPLSRFSRTTFAFKTGLSGVHVNTVAQSAISAQTWLLHRRRSCEPVLMETSTALLLVLLLIISLCWLLTLSSDKKHCFPPGPRGLPLLGNVHQVDKKAPYLTLRKVRTSLIVLFVLSAKHRFVCALRIVCCWHSWC